MGGPAYIPMQRSAGLHGHNNATGLQMAGLRIYNNENYYYYQFITCINISPHQQQQLNYIVRFSNICSVFLVVHVINIKIWYKHGMCTTCM